MSNKAMLHIGTLLLLSAAAVGLYYTVTQVGLMWSLPSMVALMLGASLIQEGLNGPD